MVKKELYETETDVYNDPTKRKKKKTPWLETRHKEAPICLLAALNSGAGTNVFPTVLSYLEVVSKMTMPKKWMPLLSPHLRLAKWLEVLVERFVQKGKLPMPSSGPLFFIMKEGKWRAIGLLTVCFLYLKKA